MAATYRSRANTIRWESGRRNWLVAAGLAAAAAHAGPSQDVRLFLKTEPGEDVRGPVVTDAGGMYAVADLEFVPSVVFQDGTDTDPNPILALGDLDIGAFDGKIPLTAVHGGGEVLLGAGSATPARTYLLLDPAGTPLVLVDEENYPAGVNVRPLDAVALRLPDAAAKGGGYAAAFLLILAYGADEFFGSGDTATYFGYEQSFDDLPVAPEKPVPQSLNVPNAPTKQTMGDRKSRQMFIPLVNIVDGGGGVYDIMQVNFTPPLFQHDPAPPPPGAVAETLPVLLNPNTGEVISAGGEKQPIVQLPVGVVGSGFPFGTQVVSAFESAPLSGGDAVVAVQTDNFSTGVAIVSGNVDARGFSNKKVRKIPCDVADLNKDGKVDEADRTLWVDYLRGQDPRGDFDKDGDVDSRDAKLLDRAIRKCNPQSKAVEEFVNAPMMLISTEFRLPGLQDHRMIDIRGVRGNGFGTAAFMVSQYNTDTQEQGTAVLILDGKGYRTLFKTGDDLGDGVIESIGDTSDRRGLSPVSANGEFAVLVGFAGGAKGVYVVSGTNVPEETGSPEADLWEVD